MADSAHGTALAFVLHCCRVSGPEGADGTVGPELMRLEGAAWAMADGSAAPPALSSRRPDGAAFQGKPNRHLEASVLAFEPKGFAMKRRLPAAGAALPVLAGLITIGASVGAEVPPGTAGAAPNEAQLGAKVRVTTEEPQSAGSDRPARITGTLVEADRDSLTILRGQEKDRLRIVRSSIRTLEVSRGSTRGRNALIGAGVGAALGLAVAAIDYSNCDEGDWCDLVWGLPVLTTPVGALIGVATGGPRWVEAAPPRVAITVRPARRGVQLACTVRF